MREDAERILAFQRVYDDAGRLLYPHETLIDVARRPVQTDSGEGVRRTDRVLRPGETSSPSSIARKRFSPGSSRR